MGASTERVHSKGEMLMGLVFGTVEGVGATLDAALVAMGDRLGLYGFRALGAEPEKVPIRDVAQTVGFGGLRRGGETPFSLALEAGP